jgi:hypothetical protein
MDRGASSMAEHLPFGNPQAEEFIHNLTRPYSQAFPLACIIRIESLKTRLYFKPDV